MSLLYENVTYQIRGACFWIWKEFGSAFKESIIERAFLEEFEHRGLAVENQKRVPIYYRGKKVGTYIPDFVINEAVIIELKAKPFLTKHDLKQFWRYLKGTNYRLGFLINFGQRLEIKRVGTSAKLAFVARIPNFEAKNRKCDDVYLEDKRRSSCDFAAEIWNSQQKWSFAAVPVVYDAARQDPRGDPRGRSAWGSAVTGFSLVEVVLSLALFAVILVAGTDLLWQVVSTRLQSAATREVHHNATAVVRRLTAEIREAQTLGQGSGQSAFGVHPGKLALDNPGPANDVVFDTATKAVTVGGQGVTIRKLRVSVGGAPPLDLTSDGVDVTNFVVRDLTRAGAPATVRLELTVAAVNPGNDPNRRATFSLETSATLRR